MSNEARPISLTVRGVTKRFAVGNDEVEALAPVDLAIPQGEFVCLIGASGCGKSTLLRIIAGFEEPTTGVASIGGKAITGPGQFGPAANGGVREDSITPALACCITLSVA